MNNAKTGCLIADSRRSLNLTQKDLAERLHVSVQAVSKWERGLSFPDVLLLEPLSEQLGLTVSELLAGARDAPPQEELVQESLHISAAQLGGKVKKWRKLFIAATVLLALLLLGLGYSLLHGHTKLLPQRKTVLSYLEQSPTAELAAHVAGGGEVALYQVTYADGIIGEELRLELWTSTGLAQVWPLASASVANPADWPRQQVIALATDADFDQTESTGLFRYSASLCNGMWRGTVQDVPYLSAGFGSNILTERTEVHPEYGVILACYYLDTTSQGRWTVTPCLGAVECPDVPAGQARLLVRLLYEYE